MTVVHAQNVDNALNFASTSSSGTARSIGFGSTLGSVGGDFSSTSVNPAGLGIYRSNEISFSPLFHDAFSSSMYQQNQTTDQAFKMGVGQFGLVLTDAPKGRRYNYRDWKSVAFAVGMERIADFNRNYNYSGNNYTSSASQAFEADANRDTMNAYHNGVTGTLGNIGVDAGLLTGDVGFQRTIVPFKSGILQTNSVQERGSINSVNIGLGGNYKEKILLGVSLGIPVVNYTRNTSYTESPLSPNSNNPYRFNSFTYNEETSVNGSGINMKLGLIWKMTENIRIGAAVHTPTYYSLTSVYDFGILSNVGGTQADYSTRNGGYLPSTFDYSYFSPAKAVLSATFLAGKLGFVSADYEYINYSTMHYAFPAGTDVVNETSFQQEANAINTSIRKLYTSSSNLRVGGELVLMKHLMLRGGLGFYGSPLADGSSDLQRIDVSGGLGVRTRHFFADFGIRNTTYTVSEQPYNSLDFKYIYSGSQVTLPAASVSLDITNYVLTVGFKF